MRAAWFFAGAMAVLLLQGGAASGQEASARETRCWVGDVVFSAGIGINAGTGTAVCAVGSGWTAATAETPVAGCLLEGKLSSIGAVVEIRNADDKLLQCDGSGRWVLIDARE